MEHASSPSTSRDYLTPPRRSMSSCVPSTSTTPSSSRRSSFDSLYTPTPVDSLLAPPTISRHLTPPASPSPFMVEFGKLPSMHQQRPCLAKPDPVSLRRSGKFLLLVLLPTAVIVTAAAAFATIATSGHQRPLPVQRLAHGELDWQKRWSNDLEVRQNVDGADVPVLTVGGLGGVSSATSSGSANDSATPTTSASASVSGTLTSTTSTTRASAPVIPSSVVLPTPFPQAFDSTLSTDFTSGTCQVFFANLTTTLSFRQCRPLSLLIPTSQAFLQVQLDKNLTSLTSIIYGTCNTTPSEDECVGRMLEFEQDIRTACAQELSSGHALAWSALNGFRNYKMVRDAGCLQNERTNTYCFVDAAAAQPPADIYLYQLPMGTPLPGSSSSSSTSSRAQSTTVAKIARDVHIPRDNVLLDASGLAKGVQITPSCSACSRSVMSIFASYATNSTLLISETYPSASRVLNGACGDGYAQSISGALSTVATSMWNVVLVGLVGIGLTWVV